MDPPEKVCKLARTLAVRSKTAAYRSPLAEPTITLFHVLLRYVTTNEYPSKKTTFHEKVYQLLYSSNNILSHGRRTQYIKTAYALEKRHDYNLGNVYIETAGLP